MTRYLNTRQLGENNEVHNFCRTRIFPFFSSSLIFFIPSSFVSFFFLLFFSTCVAFYYFSFLFLRQITVGDKIKRSFKTLNTEAPFGSFINLLIIMLNTSFVSLYADIHKKDF